VKKSFWRKNNFDGREIFWRLPPTWRFLKNCWRYLIYIIKAYFSILNTVYIKKKFGNFIKNSMAIANKTSKTFFQFIKCLNRFCNKYYRIKFLLI
jgi:hypothetical protein